MPTPRRTTRYSTRLLLSAAAVGAAGGILVIIFNYALAWLPPSTLAYSVYSATIGVWSLGPLVATALFRLPGIALLTSLFAGLVNLVAPAGFAQLPNFLIAGILLEIPFAVALYRRWSDRYLRIAIPVGLLLLSIVYFAACVVADAIRMDEFLPWLALATAVGTAVEIALVTWLSMQIAERLRRAGLGTRSTDRVVATEGGAQP